MYNLLSNKEIEIEIEIESLLGLADSLREVRRCASNHGDQMYLTSNIKNNRMVNSKHGHTTR